ncbi:hypothetical protein COB21_02105 [Candidatus Aerophobetes bacterium]|uniref:Uncharacterized protein n=1 Tax=Aerophobetes bacterium TaxID=2030807 RepID=A0A2A4X7E5_UNCAE|nr:MAG: hypothetical protein COB21_02105 [Candidatus Aerophobetes bacterium]
MSIPLILQNLPAQVSHAQAMEVVADLRQNSASLSVEKVKEVYDGFLGGVVPTFNNAGLITLSEESLNVIGRNVGIREEHLSERTRDELLVQIQVTHAIYLEKANQGPTMAG